MPKLIPEIISKRGPKARYALLLILTGLSILIIHLGASSGDPVFLGLSGIGLAVIISVMMNVGAIFQRR